MLITSIGPSIIKTGKETFQRTTTLGKYRNWYITVDEFRDSSGKITDKRFVFWNDLVQRIVNKRRNEKKGFDRYY